VLVFLARPHASGQADGRGSRPAVNPGIDLRQSRTYIIELMAGLIGFMNWGVRCCWSFCKRWLHPTGREVQNQSAACRVACHQRVVRYPVHDDRNCDILRILIDWYHTTEPLNERPEFNVSTPLPTSSRSGFGSSYGSSFIIC